MVSFDEVCKRIFSDPRWLPNVLIGGVLSFVPILNVFALGYMYRYFEQGYTTQYPVDSLQFDYLPTYKRTARALRKQWRDDYKAQHGGQLPPLDGHKR